LENLGVVSQRSGHWELQWDHGTAT